MINSWIVHHVGCSTTRKVTCCPSPKKRCSLTERLCHTLAHTPIIFGGMVTYYCISLEEALRRAKIAGKQPGCYYGGITLRSGKKGFAVYKDGKVIEQYSIVLKNAHRSER